METAIDLVNKLVWGNRGRAVSILGDRIENVSWDLKRKEAELNAEIVEMICSRDMYSLLDDVAKLSTDYMTAKQDYDNKIKAMQYIIDYIKADEKASSGSICDKVVPGGKTEFNAEYPDNPMGANKPNPETCGFNGAPLD